VSDALTLSCYGICIRLVNATSDALLRRLADTLPPELVACTTLDEGAVSYVITGDAASRAGGLRGYGVTRDGVEIYNAAGEEDVLEWLRSDIDGTVVRRSPEVLFVHAGVVGWRGLAIVIPGRSHTGKSTLVAELVQRGAVYYSDEFAVLDERGHVHPYRRSLALRSVSGEASALNLARDDAPRHALPIGLIVAGSYLPGAAWRPTVLRGTHAVLPIIDGTILAREQPDRTLRVAARVSSTAVALQGPRSEAGEVALDLLELVDDALVSHALCPRRRGDGALAADLWRVATQRFRSRHRRPAPPDRRLIAARYVRMTDFLSPPQHGRLLEHVLACRDGLHESSVIDPQGRRILDHTFRRSHTLAGPRLEEMWSMFEERLRGLLPGVRRALGMPWFPLGKVERQLAVHDNNGFFAPHVDISDAVTAKRRISGVYYFHRTPRRYAGGALRLYDTWVTPKGSTPAGTYTDLAPIDNSAVFFRSDAVHAVCPVRSETDAFGDGRFAVTIWFWEGERRAALDGPVRSQ
jgi:hypothetical protein